MKIFTLTFSLILSLAVSAIDSTTVYTNADNCKIEMSEAGSVYVITASKKVDGYTKSAQVIVRDDLTKGNITTHCMKEGAVVVEDGDTVTVSCNNKRAVAKMDFENQELTTFDFSGYHYNFLCSDLVVE